MARISARMQEATEELARRDRVFAKAIKRYGPCKFRKPRGDTRFTSLASSIAYQQLNGKAAATIWGRVVDLMPKGVTPEAVLKLSDKKLRSAGLSNAKTRSLQDLALKVAEGTVELDRMGRMADDAIIDELVLVRGIGRWTAQMFLMFTLGRLDVWPIDDYGVRKGYANLHGLKELPPPKELEKLGAHLSPVRSVAAWYCWRAADTQTL